MAFKAVLFVCAQALVMQSISGQCIGAGLGAPWGVGAWDAAPWGVAGAWDAAPWGVGAWGTGLGYGYDALAPAAAAASHGGGLPVASASAIPPTGVSVASENAYCGELAVGGALPFLGTVSLEGVLPTAGAGAIAYGCGNGAVGMVSEDIGGVGIAGPLGFRGDALGYGIGAYGYDGAIAPFGRAGCGCGRGAFI